jgi:hypothetical protein
MMGSATGKGTLPDTGDVLDGKHTKIRHIIPPENHFPHGIRSLEEEQPTAGISKEKNLFCFHPEQDDG